jgi:hypothetical protein
MRSVQVERLVVGLDSVQTQLSPLMARHDAEAVTMVRETLAELRRPLAARSIERLDKEMSVSAAVGRWTRSVGKSCRSCSRRAVLP